ncbi:hypothetical protein Aperf_G00000067481 [Anoplocephala perfoliata]
MSSESGPSDYPNSATHSTHYPNRDTTFTKIFVGGLPYHTTDTSLRAFFERFGEIEEAVVITDRQTGKSRGYGFVTMARREDAINAISDPNPCIDGRKANVNLAVLGAKPRAIAGVSNAANILAMAGAEMNLLGQFTNSPAPVNPAALFGNPGAINSAVISSFMALNGMMGGTPRPLFQPPQTPISAHSQGPTEFSRAPNHYLGQPPQVVNSAASVIANAAAANPYALAQLMYGPNAVLNWSQQQQAINAAASTLGIPSVGTLSPTFTGDMENFAHTGGSQIQVPPPPPQVTAQLMTGDALTRATNVAPPAWSSMFHQTSTTSLAPTNGVNSNRDSPRHNMDHGSNCAPNKHGMGAQMYENASDHGNGNALQLRSLM